MMNNAQFEVFIEMLSQFDEVFVATDESTARISVAVVKVEGIPTQETVFIFHIKKDNAGFLEYIPCGIKHYLPGVDD